MRDVRIGPLLMRQPNVEPDTSSSGVGGAAIGRLHNSRTASRADHVPMSVLPKTLRPDRDQSRKLARLLVVASERALGSNPRRAEKHDGLVYLLAAKDAQRLEIFGKNSNWTSFMTIEKLLILVGERWIGGRRIRFARFHDFFTRAKSTKPRSTSTRVNSTPT